jgi:hypothetical protein
MPETNRQHPGNIVYFDKGDVTFHTRGSLAVRAHI